MCKALFLWTHAPVHVGPDKHTQWHMCNTHPIQFYHHSQPLAFLSLPGPCTVNRGGALSKEPRPVCCLVPLSHLVTLTLMCLYCACLYTPLLLGQCTLRDRMIDLKAAEPWMGRWLLSGFLRFSLSLSFLVVPGNWDSLSDVISLHYVKLSNWRSSKYNLYCICSVNLRISKQNKTK